jgi:hypothetical protein
MGIKITRNIISRLRRQLKIKSQPKKQKINKINEKQ